MFPSVALSCARKGLCIGILVTAAILAGCGGGGGGGETAQGPQGTSGTASVFSWSAPATFNDNTPLNPATDIEYYELYLRADRNFPESDPPVAQIAAVTEQITADGLVAGKNLVTSFPLDLLPSLPSGKLLYVSLRAFGVDKQKSMFMEPIAWDRS